MGGKCGKHRKTSAVSAAEIIEEKPPLPKSSPIQDFLVGDVSSISEDKLTEVKINEKASVLVGKDGESIYAIGAKCPHAGAPLINGVLRDGKVRCPWHAACFDLKTGDLEDFPGFDCIPSYNVAIRQDKVYVQLDPSTISDRRLKPMTRLKCSEPQFVIIGSGPCGYSCAQTLREEGFAGKILLVTSDPFLPYDRTKLSKRLDATIDNINLRATSFYENYDIEILLNQTVIRIHPDTREIEIDGRSNPLSYDSLFLAVGMEPKRLNVPGRNLKNIHVLHSLSQAMEFIESARDKTVALIGSSFISMEMAELLSPIVSHIHIISRSRFPYSATFGDKVGETLHTHFLQKLTNVTFHPFTEVEEFIGNDLVTGLLTRSGDIIHCDTVLTAIGGIANTQFLSGSGIQLHPRNGTIRVNDNLKTNCEGIWAGGDAVSFPLKLAQEREEGHVAHWQLASLHGRLAALSILGKSQITSDIYPFFWTNVCGLQVRYLGYGDGYDETVMYGDLDKPSFVVVYRRNRSLVAVCCIGTDNLAAELAIVLKSKSEWGAEIPEPITKRFPDGPIKSKLTTELSVDDTAAFD